ncbi:MAG: cohesin domain-containing protein [Anaerolineae bacterium]
MTGWWIGLDARRQKTLLLLLGMSLALLALGVWAPPCSAEAASLYVVPSTAQIYPGDTLTVTVVVSGVADLTSLDLRMFFDPEILKVRDANPVTTGTVEITPGNIFTSQLQLMNQVDNGTGQIEYSVLADASPPFSGQGTVAVVTFKGIASGTSVFGFDLHDLWDSATATITHTVGGGLYEVVPPTYLPAIYRNYHRGFELIDNGDCESDEGWFFRSSEYTGGYSTVQTHAGDWALRTGIEEGGVQTYSYSSATQLVDVPSDASAMELSFWVYRESVGDDSDAADRHYAIIIDPWLNYYYLFFDTGHAETHQPEWIRLSYDESVLASYRGEQVQLHFETFNDGAAARSAMYVDDVSWLVWP